MVKKITRLAACIGIAGAIMTGTTGTAIAEDGHSANSVKLVSPDHKEREAVPLPGGGGKKINLQPGDRLELRNNAKESLIINSNDKVIGVFDSPQIKIGEKGYAAHFEVNGNELLLSFDQGVRLPRSCIKGQVGKWSYRGLAALTCGAAGIGGGPLVGGACGLGTAALEDQINFDKNC